MTNTTNVNTNTTAEETKIAVVGGVEIPVPAHLSIDEIREGLAHAYPSIQGSKAIEEDGYVRFFKEAGEKGSEEVSDEASDETSDTKIAVVGGVEIPVPAHLSIDEIREGLAHAYPSIQGSKAIEEDGYVRFFKEAGEKGSDDVSSESSPETKIAVVGGVEIPVPAHLSIDEIREGLAHAYPSIQGSKAIEEDGYVRFFKEAGEKGSDEVTSSESAATKIAVVGGVEIPVPAHLSIDEIREGLAHAYPSIQGSKAIEEDGYVRFFKEAGEKGSDDASSESSDTKIAVVGGVEIPVPAHLSIDEIREGLAHAYPSIQGSKAIEEDGYVRFFKEAGEKGSGDVPEWVQNALPQEDSDEEGETEIPEWVSNALPQEPETPEWVTNALPKEPEMPEWASNAVSAVNAPPAWVTESIEKAQDKTPEWVKDAIDAIELERLDEDDFDEFDDEDEYDDY